MRNIYNVNTFPYLDMRDKLIGYLDDNRLFAVVHLELEGESYRIVSASPAERDIHDS